jgi:hypothetical protein
VGDVPVSLDISLHGGSSRIAAINLRDFSSGERKEKVSILHTAPQFRSPCKMSPFAWRGQAKNPDILAAGGRRRRVTRKVKVVAGPP